MIVLYLQQPVHQQRIHPISKKEISFTLLAAKWSEHFDNDHSPSVGYATWCKYIVLSETIAWPSRRHGLSFPNPVPMIPNLNLFQNKKKHPRGCPNRSEKTGSDPTRMTVETIHKNWTFQDQNLDDSHSNLLESTLPVPNTQDIVNIIPVTTVLIGISASPPAYDPLHVVFLLYPFLFHW